MSALRAVLKTRLPPAGIRLGTQTNACLRMDSCIKVLSNTIASFSSRSVSAVQQSSSADSVKRKDEAEEEENNEPVKFTSSRAATWRAEHTWRGTGEELDDMPAIQPLVVSLSMAALMIYFCCLREENDIDEKLVKDLDDLV